MAHPGMRCKEGDFVAASRVAPLKVKVPPLKVMDNFQGWGNRIGWWLTNAALGEALNRTVYTGWHGAPKTAGGRNYDYATVRSLVRFPRALHFMEDIVEANRTTGRWRWRAGGANARAQQHSDEQRREAGAIPQTLTGATFKAAFRALDAEEVPYHPKPYVNDYIPEPAWEMIQGWKRRGLFAPPPCLTRTVFEAAWRQVGQQLGSPLEACLPERKRCALLRACVLGRSSRLESA